MRPATGISWVFDRVETAIILEDDCIPHPSFFRFCDELLEKYRHDTRVMHISGNNYWSKQHPRDENYTFSRYPMSWGWATWRRAWQYYDFDMKLWPEIAHEKSVGGFMERSTYSTNLDENFPGCHRHGFGLLGLPMDS